VLPKFIDPQSNPGQHAGADRRVGVEGQSASASVSPVRIRNAWSIGALDLAPPRLLRLRALPQDREQQAGEDLAAVE
jgi:hypothetical protein